jgi:hypothetical protein
MNIRIKLSFFTLLAILLLMISCKTDVENSSTLPSPSPEYLDVCDVTKNIAQYNNKTIKIKAKIKGYHELVLYDDSCPEDGNLIKIEFSDLTQKQLFDISNKANFQKSDITGDIFVLGKIEQDAGRLSYYKPVRVDTKQSDKGIVNEVLVVNQIRCDQIIRFDPKAE